MLKDPIVEEVRKYREEYVAQFNFDLDTMFNALKAKESQSGLNYEKRVFKPYHPNQREQNITPNNALNAVARRRVGRASLPPQF